MKKRITEFKGKCMKCNLKIKETDTVFLIDHAQLGFKVCKNCIKGERVIWRWSPKIKE